MRGLTEIAVTGGEELKNKQSLKSTKQSLKKRKIVWFGDTKLSFRSKARFYIVSNT